MKDIKTFGGKVTMKVHIPRGVVAIVCVTIAVVFLLRILGPSDLYQNLDQSKTVSFTADMVLHGHWALPIDAMGEPSRKPPLYNWIGVPIFAAGWHNEFALKLPSVLAGLVTIWLTFLAAWRLFGRKQIGLACVAAAIWIAAPDDVKQIYFARPDMLLIALLTGGWLSAMRTLDAPPDKARIWTFAMWLCTGLGVLTKGPIAMLIPIYAALHVLIIGTRTNESDARQRGIKSTLRLGWWWGMPMVLVMVVAWLIPAYLANPEYVRVALLGSEMGSRLNAFGGAHSVGKLLAAHFRPIAFFIERFVPWSVLSIIGLFMLGPIKRWREHRLAPAALWVVLVLVVMILFAGRGGSYVAPAYPAAAILAAFALSELLGFLKVASRKRVAIIAICALIVAISIGVRDMFFSRGARTGTGKALTIFARQASDIVGREHVVFSELDYVPISTLMGRHQAGAPDERAISQAQWIIMPVREDMPEPVLKSGELQRLCVQGGGELKGQGAIGLWPIDSILSAIHSEPAREVNKSLVVESL